jgi:hypothetical protein
MVQQSRSGWLAWKRRCNREEEEHADQAASIGNGVPDIPGAPKHAT